MPAKFKQTSQKQRELIPEGQYDAICYGIVELGTHTRISKMYGEKTNEEVMVMFEIPELTITYEKDGKEVTAPRVINQKFNNVMGDKSKLRAFLNAWRGKPLTDEEASNFDMSKILGHGAGLSIAHSEDGKYANITTISPLHKSVKLGKPVNPVINFGIDDIDSPVFETLYPWVQNIIKESHEYKSREEIDEVVDTEEEGDIPF